jgi:DNA polymerase-3 subunit gamma/tau
MGDQVLARKYRPQRFADVAGQDHVTRTLMNALSQNRIAHGYIVSGHKRSGSPKRLTAEQGVLFHS